MKTKIKMLVAFISMMLAFIVTINAETIPGCGCQTDGYSPTTGQSCVGNVPGLGPIPGQLPIGDGPDMQALLWEQVAQIGLFGWAPSTIHSSTNLRTDVVIPYLKTNGVVDVKGIFRIIKEQRLILSVLYPSDSINLQSGLYDSDGNNLFYAYASSGINPPQNGVSTNRLSLVFNMNDSIWIPFNGASWFQIIERDENGNPVRYYSSKDWDIRDGKIRFYAYFAKKHGEIRITLCDGTEVAYSLNGGSRIIPTTVQVDVGDVSAIGLRTFQNTNVAYIFVEVFQEEFERNINPLSQINSTGWVYLAAGLRRNPNTLNTENASALHYWLQGQPSSTAQRIEIPEGYWAPVYLSGRYWVKFEFPSGWPGDKNQFNPPYQYDSKTEIEEK